MTGHTILKFTRTVTCNHNMYTMTDSASAAKIPLRIISILFFPHFFWKRIENVARKGLIPRAASEKENDCSVFPEIIKLIRLASSSGLQTRLVRRIGARRCGGITRESGGRAPANHTRNWLQQRIDIWRGSGNKPGGQPVVRDSDEQWIGSFKQVLCQQSIREPENRSYQRSGTVSSGINFSSADTTAIVH